MPVTFCPLFALEEGGRSVAFVGEPGVLYVAEVAPQLDFRTIKFAQSPKAPQIRHVRCFWVRPGKIVTGWGKSIYEVSPDNQQARFVSAGHLAGVVQNSAILVSAPISPFLRFSNITSGKTIGQAQTRHSYSAFSAIDPTGEYVAYVVPGAFSNKGRFYVHELQSGRRAALRIDPRWVLGSWSESP